MEKIPISANKQTLLMTSVAYWSILTLSDKGEDESRASAIVAKTLD